jgi:hypothetical protein
VIVELAADGIHHQLLGHGPHQLLRTAHQGIAQCHGAVDGDAVRQDLGGIDRRIGEGVVLAPAADRVEVLEAEADRIDEDEGSLEVRLFNVRNQRATGPEVTRAQQIRYLSEMIWNPGAITLHPHLDWRDLSGRRILVSCRSHLPDTHVEVHFDGHGDPACVTAMRPRLEGSETTTRPWAAHMWRYSALEGLRIPTRAEVRWDLPTGPFVYWRGEIVALQVLD